MSYDKYVFGMITDVGHIFQFYYFFSQYCRQQNPTLMEQLFYQEDNFQEEANCKVVYSFQKEVSLTIDILKLLKMKKSAKSIDPDEVAHYDNPEVQEELLYYPWRRRWRRH